MKVEITEKDIRDYEANVLGQGFFLLVVSQKIDILAGKLKKATKLREGLVARLNRGNRGRKKSKLTISRKKYARLEANQKEIELITFQLLKIQNENPNYK